MPLVMLVIMTFSFFCSSFFLFYFFLLFYYSLHTSGLFHFFEKFYMVSDHQKSLIELIHFKLPIELRDCIYGGRSCRYRHPKYS